MTRVLAELLGADWPTFRLHLQQLERGAGHPNHDIRISTHIKQAVQTKLRELDLDIQDTTGPELYAALGEHLKADEARFAKALQGSDPTGTDPLEHLARALEEVVSPKTCFAMKSTVAKKLLKLTAPKKTMKALGYRSVDSMLKHETITSLYAAAWLVESQQWIKKITGLYSKLASTDFELRRMTIEYPTSKRWHELGETVVAERKDSVLSFKELGAVVLLPLPVVRPDLATLTTAVMTLNAINDIHASSTFLQLHQVRPNFGAMVRQVVQGEPSLASGLLDQPISWNAIHRYYARIEAAVRADIFEPVVQAEGIVWHNIERLLAHIEPSLSFWKNTGYLALLYEGQAVSVNLTDLLLSHCNHLPYESRLNHYFEQTLLTELSLAYMNGDHLEEAVSSVLHTEVRQQPYNQLAAETAVA